MVKISFSKYQTTHVEEFVSSKITTNEIFESIDIFDEPYSDPSTVVALSLLKLFQIILKLQFLETVEMNYCLVMKGLLNGF